MIRLYKVVVRPLAAAGILLMFLNGCSSQDRIVEAAESGNLSAVKTALADSADVNAKHNGDFTSLWIAAQNGHADVVRLLLEKGADINARRTSDSTTPLFIAAQNGHADVVRLLLDKGADVNLKRTDTGVTVLTVAAECGHADIVTLLLQKGADINARRTTDGITALFMAAQKGHAEVVKILLKNGADVNAKRTDIGATALIVASEYGHTEIVKLLLEKHADVNIVTTNGLTALGLARSKSHTDILQLLKKAGANEAATVISKQTESDEASRRDVNLKAQELRLISVQNARLETKDYFDLAQWNQIKPGLTWAQVEMIVGKPPFFEKTVYTLPDGSESFTMLYYFYKNGLERTVILSHQELVLRVEAGTVTLSDQGRIVPIEGTQ